MTTLSSGGELSRQYRAAVALALAALLVAGCGGSVADTAPNPKPKPTGADGRRREAGRPAAARPPGPVARPRRHRERAAAHPAGLEARAGKLARPLPPARLLRHLRQLDPLDRRRVVARAAAHARGDARGRQRRLLLELALRPALGDLPPHRAARTARARLRRRPEARDRRPVDGRPRRDGLCRPASRRLPGRGIVLRPAAPAGRPALHARALRERDAGADRHLGRPAARSQDVGEPRSDRARPAPPRHEAVRLLRQRTPRAAPARRPARHPDRADRPAREPRVRRAGERAGLPVRTDFYGAGNHDWPYWQRELRRSLPTVLAA